jgi:prepilin-type N-terminal cleavage/methylation domain-containing protein
MSFGKKLLPPRNGNAAGFTLIEILVAMTIFSFAVLGMAAGTVTLTRTNQNSHLHTSAVNLAQARLEDFRAMTAATFAALACPDFGADLLHRDRRRLGATFTRSWRIDFSTHCRRQQDRRLLDDGTNQSDDFSIGLQQGDEGIYAVARSHDPIYDASRSTRIYPGRAR